MFMQMMRQPLVFPPAWRVIMTVKKNDYISLLTANNLLEGSIKYTCLEDVILAYKHHYQNCYSADPVKV